MSMNIIKQSFLYKIFSKYSAEGHVKKMINVSSMAKMFENSDAGQEKTYKRSTSGGKKKTPEISLDEILKEGIRTLFFISLLISTYFVNVVEQISFDSTDVSTTSDAVILR